MKTLETKRLVLRNWTESDAEDMYEYARIEGVGEMAGWPHHDSIEVTKGIIKGFIEKGDVYAIVLKEQNKVIGSLGIHNRTLDSNYTADIQREIGYVISKTYWGMGIAVEAARAAIKYVFEDIKADVFWCGYFTTNHQSKRVAEKLGFKFYKNGQYDATPLNKIIDAKNYIMTKDDYKQIYTV